MGSLLSLQNHSPSGTSEAFTRLHLLQVLDSHWIQVVCSSANGAFFSCRVSSLLASGGDADFLLVLLLPATGRPGEKRGTNQVIDIMRNEDDILAGP